MMAFISACMTSDNEVLCYVVPSFMPIPEKAIAPNPVASFCTKVVASTKMVGLLSPLLVLELSMFFGSKG